MALDPLSLKAVATAFKRPLDDLYDKLKQAGHTRIALRANDQAFKNLHTRFREIAQVKTLWNLEKSRSLYEFYYPTSLKGKNTSSARIDRIDELPSHTNFLIEGTVGQGKSTFLRYLCCQELRNKASARVPIFVELRFLQDKTSLKKLIFIAFERLGFKIDDELLRIYASSGRFVLLLDAFDEIETALVTSTINDLTTLATTFPSLQIIVTSRPESQLARSPAFETATLLPLSARDRRPLLKLILGEKESRTVADAIANDRTGVKDLLTTPLLLTLLAILYRSTQTIPENVASFYRELFDVLFYRHDRTKAGFIRRRSHSTSEGKIRALFEAFCFACRAKEISSLTSSQFEECAEIASALTRITVNAQAFRSDIVDVACLLQEEGRNYHFVHKSVAEFYAASFIQRSSEEFAQKFYETMAHRYHSWRQEAYFLGQIDAYKYAKFFELPQIDQLLDHFKISKTSFLSTPKINVEIAKRILRHGKLKVSFFAGATDVNGANIGATSLKNEFQEALWIEFFSDEPFSLLFDATSEEEVKRLKEFLAELERGQIGKPIKEEIIDGTYYYERQVNAFDQALYFLGEDKVTLRLKQAILGLQKRYKKHLQVTLAERHKSTMLALLQGSSA